MLIEKREQIGARASLLANRPRDFSTSELQSLLDVPDHLGLEQRTFRAVEKLPARGSELKIDHVHIGERGKLACMQRIAAGMGIGMDEVAFMGDDLPDLSTLRGVGLAIAPANAHHWVLPAVHWVTPRDAGHGAARDACDLLLQAQDKVEAILAHGEHP